MASPSQFIGQTISHYRISEKLGGGGMGVVYKAEDTRLHRFVALKFLPEEVARDPQALARFQREAQAASALNHSNICTIYDIGNQDGQAFIAMEFLEGNTLQHLLGTGKLPLSEMLDLSIQIADALDAAHAKGILHRDMKPGNIFITSRKQAKVLDFGLAKLTADPRLTPGVASPTAPTVTRQEHLTRPGTAMGTVAYMAPEQALGRNLDGRTDLFSLGVVLYEMATGTLPFRGETSPAVFEAILHHDPPDPSQISAGLPPELGHIILKALEKDRELRYHSAADLRTDLKRLKRDTESGPVSRTRHATGTVIAPKNHLWRLAVIALAAIVLIALLAFWLSIPPPLPKLVGSVQITNDGLDKWSLLSDGARLYFHEYVAGKSVLVQVSTRGGESAQIPVPLNNFQIQDISPNRSELLVTSEAEALTEVPLWIVPLPAGSPHRVLGVLAHAAGWAPDGVHIAYANGNDLYFAKADGSDVRKLTSAAGEPYFIRFSPDGGHLRFSVSNMKENVSSLWEVAANGTNLHRLLAEEDKVAQSCCGSWSPDGKYFYFVNGQNTWVLSEGTSFFEEVQSPCRGTNYGPSVVL